MRVRVLGCSGGINQDVATTSYMVDDDILIDAGTGVCNLSLDEMRGIKHIFITHSHLDHISSIPLLADTLFDDLVGNPIVVHALPETIKALQDHIFNWVIWPNFTELPHKTNAVLKLEVMEAGSVLDISGRSIEMISVNHTVPGVGYCIESESKVFAFSGDTTSNENFWVSLNKRESLDLLFVESAYADKDIELAKMAFHYCPKLLAQDLAKLNHKTKVCISHLKPRSEQEIIEQCKTAMPDQDIHQLKSNDAFQL
ncbi:CAMP phosphodiesterases class-II:Metallo-beta-lactamase superfamily [hydrothermal vent metagenome]|uniref:cAMP phosphodiesterases class-II:Metallo-beta-lactamase superfamily n=1 Tax=hydrothermal vent metagenome TaxID=652676 RepID=A0A3B0WF76_9ZZZZ